MIDLYVRSVITNIIHTFFGCVKLSSTSHLMERPDLIMYTVLRVRKNYLLLVIHDVQKHFRHKRGKQIQN